MNNYLKWKFTSVASSTKLKITQYIFFLQNYIKRKKLIGFKIKYTKHLYLLHTYSYGIK